MLDFNHRLSFSEVIMKRIDLALDAENKLKPKRNYLGASRLGASCDRALQYEYSNTPKDSGRDFLGTTLRNFDAGHVFEELMVRWLKMAGFELLTHNSDGDQFGFETLNGKIQGHIDGVIVNAPSQFDFSFPMLWECKSKANKVWRQIKNQGVEIVDPVYAAQMPLYQAYLEPQFPGISSNPALFTAINKETAEIHFELVAFNGALAQQRSDRGVRIIEACEAGELQPRMTKTDTHYECRICPWQDRCWERVPR
ncbi:PD-(D/E)XK nuclease family protein [Teredinibacter sp. KSP-S5-2]|uniref:PD-(D/E)XK nuclease family protein n=1 Tax=Teredinibacter sp. KSP-S5-2 TaxID=3034506 RepID=UPI00293436B1|nr:PD-(D/E)XK nuclease family protein [Teredinibacter sp. KSP-S5-2]WNO10400.1 hypothetical protein P5V12_04375 [Teredinibacter sp. KSP-S5-2]